jgi:hypothetical protein
MTSCQVLRISAHAGRITLVEFATAELSGFFRPQPRSIRLRPVRAKQTPSDSASGDNANCGHPLLCQHVGQHLRRNNHEKGQNGAEENESHDGRSKSPIPNIAHRLVPFRIGVGRLVRADVRRSSTGLTQQRPYVWADWLSGSTRSLIVQHNSIRTGSELSGVGFHLRVGAMGPSGAGAHARRQSGSPAPILSSGVGSGRSAAAPRWRVPKGQRRPAAERSCLPPSRAPIGCGSDFGCHPDQDYLGGDDPSAAPTVHSHWPSSGAERGALQRSQRRKYRPIKTAIARGLPAPSPQCGRVTATLAGADFRSIHQLAPDASTAQSIGYPEISYEQPPAIGFTCQPGDNLRVVSDENGERSPGRMPRPLAFIIVFKACGSTSTSVSAGASSTDSR